MKYGDRVGKIRGVLSHNGTITCNDLAGDDPHSVGATLRWMYGKGEIGRVKVGGPGRGPSVYSILSDSWKYL